MKRILRGTADLVIVENGKARVVHIDPRFSTAVPLPVTRKMMSDREQALRKGIEFHTALAERLRNNE